LTEDEQISKAALELVAEFKRIKSKNRGGAGGARGGAWSSCGGLFLH